MSELLKNRVLVVIGGGSAGTQLGQHVYDALMTGTSADMMLESVSIDDIDQTYLGAELINNQHGAMFEAITSERIRLSNTMRAFVRALSRGLNGTGITAGTDDAGEDSEGQKTVGGAIIGKVRRVANIPVMSAQIPLSDGQSVSLVFHSPTAENGKIRNHDTLVAFQFLINKRDVTHIVAPIGGRDVSLQQVSQALANLIEKNSGKFTKQKDAQAKLKSEIEATRAETDQLAEQQSALLEQAEEQQARVYARQDNEQALRGKLASQKQINSDLTSQLASLQKAKENAPANNDAFTDRTVKVKASLNMDGKATLSNGATVSYSVEDVGGELTGKVVITEADGTVYEMPSPSSQGGDMGSTATKLLKAYRTGKAEKYRLATAQPAPQPEPEPQPEPTPDVSGATWRYALVNRPAGIGAVPPGFIQTLDQPAQGQPYSNIARNGIIVYDRQLTDKEISDFELKLLPTHADLDELAGRVAGNRMYDYATEYLEMSNDDLKTYEKQVQLFARKEMPNVAYPQGDDLTYFLGAMKTALGKVSAGIPDIEEPEPTGASAIAAKKLGDLIDWAWDLVNAWGQSLGYDAQQLGEIANYVSQHATPDYLKTVNDAMTLGKRIPLVEELAGNAADEQPRMSNKEALSYLENYSFGNWDTKDFVSPGADVETIKKQYLALGNLYAAMDNAISEQTDVTLGKTDRESLLGHYVGMSQYGAHEVANWLTSRKTSTGDLINMSPVNNPFDAEKLIKGGYSSAEVQKMLVDSGGYLPVMAAKPELQPEPEPQPEPQPEADTEAQKAIDYLSGLTSLQTDDMIVIRNARSQVREAIAALTAASVYEENESLVNEAVQHLSDLLVAVQRAGAAA